MIRSLYARTNVGLKMRMKPAKITNSTPAARSSVINFASNDN